MNNFNGKKRVKVSSKSADYTVLDNDEMGVLLITTGSSANVVINLPTLADNQDRIIEIIKVDSGTKFVEINPGGFIWKKVPYFWGR